MQKYTDKIFRIFYTTTTGPISTKLKYKYIPVLNLSKFYFRTLLNYSLKMYASLRSLCLEKKTKDSIT